MDAREFLENISMTEARVQLKVREIEHLRESLTSISVATDTEQVSHSRNVTIMSETISRIVDIQAEIDVATAKLMKQKSEIYRMLDMMNPELALLLAERYIQKKQLKEISSTHYLSKRHVLRKLDAAISEFQNILDRTIKEPSDPIYGVNKLLVCDKDVT